MESVYISLGSNQGDRLNNLNQSIRLLSQIKGVKIIKGTSVYETSAWGKTDQPNYFNSVLSIRTNLDPFVFLNYLQNIENKLGRIRLEKWGPRTIDLDILLFGNKIIRTKELVIPHPYIQERSFILIPLLEIASQIRHPVTGKSFKEILKNTKNYSFDKIGILDYFNRKGK